MTTLLPPGVSEESFRAAYDEFVALLGQERVLLHGKDDLTEYRDPYEPESWELFLPSAVVHPKSTEEVQEVVRIANRHTITLWVHGAGKNNAYGGGAPGVNGAVTISFREFREVLEINEELGYAVVSPGTTWQELYDAIQAGGHNLMLSCTDLGWGSVIANATEHGLTYTPYGQDFQMPCGMEVVLPDGDVLRTGMGAMPNNNAWHLYKRGLGPTLDQLFMQSNFGIVTRMGVWLAPMPETFRACWVRIWDEKDVIPLVDRLRELRLDRTIEGVPVMYNTLLAASAMSKRTQWYEGDDPIPDDIIDHVAKELQVGRFGLRFALFGDEQVVEYNWEKCRKAFETVPGADVWSTKCAGKDIPNLEHPGERTAGGIPGMTALNQTYWYSEEHGGHIGAAPAVPLTGEEFYKSHLLMREVVEKEAGVDYMAGIPIINARTVLPIACITYDTTNEEQSRDSYEAAKLLITRLAENGYGEYRTHIDTMDHSQATFSWNDNAYLRFVEKLKDAVDPNGILMPGKQGIWPERLRPQR
ncbi:unannotated protein [freshwater metagenome]|uniref:Unannotated protein n=1 Tax=freshwater metagenome TaxID=449393 RepID=A0A6J7IUJ4_9ZZZZ|nr:FAD-binding protein [Actinomycetota bacterium]